MSHYNGAGPNIAAFLLNLHEYNVLWTKNNSVFLLIFHFQLYMLGIFGKYGKLNAHHKQSMQYGSKVC